MFIDVIFLLVFFSSRILHIRINVRLPSLIAKCGSCQRSISKRSSITLNQLSRIMSSKWVWKKHMSLSRGTYQEEVGSCTFSRFTILLRLHGGANGKGFSIGGVSWLGIEIPQLSTNARFSRLMDTSFRNYSVKLPSFLVFVLNHSGRAEEVVKIDGIEDRCEIWCGVEITKDF